MDGKSCGVGDKYSGGSNKSKTRAWSNPPMTKSRMGKTVSGKKMNDRYQARSKNPSGAPAGRMNYET